MDAPACGAVAVRVPVSGRGSSEGSGRVVYRQKRRGCQTRFDVLGRLEEKRGAGRALGASGKEESPEKFGLQAIFEGLNASSAPFSVTWRRRRRLARRRRRRGRRRRRRNDNAWRRRRRRRRRRNDNAWRRSLARRRRWRDATRRRRRCFARRWRWRGASRRWGRLFTLGRRRGQDRGDDQREAHDGQAQTPEGRGIFLHVFLPVSGWGTLG